MRTGDTFLTSLGTDVYEGFNSYNDQGTSQSTVLLQKRKKMQEVQLALERKKAEFEERMRRCKAKEMELASKQKKIEKSVERFEKFVKENDAKRVRAQRREKEEMVAARQKQHDIEALQRDLAKYQQQQCDLVTLLERLSVYEEFLEGVVDSSEEFQEIPDVLAREETLRACNLDLRREGEECKAKLEETRAKIATNLKEGEDSLLVHMSDIATLQKRLESLRDEISKLEAVLQQKQAGANERQRELGAAKMSLLNLAERCMKREHKHLSQGMDNEEGVEKILEYVNRRMLDLQDITSAYQGAGPEQQQRRN